jgi:hypothetical protein
MVEVSGTLQNRLSRKRQASQRWGKTLLCDDNEQDSDFWNAKLRAKKMKLNKHCHTVLAGAALIGIATFSRPAEAQVRPSFYGSGEADTRNVQFYLVGMYLGTGGLGWTPYFDINGWLLDYPIAGTRQKLGAVNPTAGLAYSNANSGVSFGGGYAFVRNFAPTLTSVDQALGVPGAASGGENGVTASFGTYRNGRGRRAANAQLLAEYNFGAQYVWARGRGSVPFGYSVRHPARVGLELIGQGGGKNGITSNEFDVGPTFEYAWTPNFSTTGVIGYKSVGGNPAFASRESAAYFKLEFSYSP